MYGSRVMAEHAYMVGRSSGISLLYAHYIVLYICFFIRYNTALPVVTKTFCRILGANCLTVPIDDVRRYKCVDSDDICNELPNSPDF